MNTYENQSAGDRHREDKFCPQCGAHMPAGDRFCRNCGAKLADEPSPKARQSSHKKVWFSVAAVILLIFAAVMLSQNFSGQSAVVEDVKSAAFGQDAPFGTMIERTCDNIQWSQEKMDDNVQVEVSGTMQTIKYHSELEGIPFYFTLVATYHGDGSCIDGYYNLNLVQVRYNQFVSDYPEYSTAYYRTNILGLGNENVSTGNTDTPEISQGLGRDWLMETFFPGISYDTLPAVFKQEIDNYAAASDSAGFVDALQNSDAFRFTDDLLGAGVTYKTAGALQGGRKVWLLARMPHRYIIAGDEIAPYLVVMNSHDGSSGTKVAMTPIRVVCQNTLNLALK